MAERVPFRSHDLTRALKAAKAGGVVVGKIELQPDGRITIVSETEPARPENALDGWLKTHAG